MPDVTATAHVFPSANDLEGGQPNGWGETLYEKNLADFWLGNLFAQNCVISGGALPATDPDLTMTVPTGKAYLGGHFVEWAALNVTLPASSTSHLYVKLLRDVNGNVSSVALEHNTSGTPPADSVKLGTAVTSGSAVTSTTDARSFAFIDQARLIKPCVGTPELKTATGSATVSSAHSGGSGVTIVSNVTMNARAFFPSLTYVTSGGFSGSGDWAAHGSVSDPANTTGRVQISSTSGGDGVSQGNSSTTTLRWDYVTASDMPEIWVACDPTTGRIVSSWASDDPPPDGSPGVTVEGCLSLRLTAQDLEQFASLSPKAGAASAYIRERKLRMDHQAYRALQLLANDMAPSRWILENCELKLGKIAERSQARNS